MARLEALRTQLRGEGLFELQKQLARPVLPKTIGVVTAEGGAARRDLLAGLARRGWGGTVVWAFAPVQDRHAAPTIARALQDLAARPEIEAIVVTRGGGSLADLWAFCDETLCRTVAMLRVPVVSAVGHERDSTLIDDVAAVCCSTPTHAAEAAVPLDCGAARRRCGRMALALRRGADGAIGARARHLGALARGPARALQRQRTILNQKTREIRAASERGIAERTASQRRIAGLVLERARRRALGQVERAGEEGRRHGAALDMAADRAVAQRREALRQAAVALRAHDPERTLERGYALAETEDGEPLTGAAAVAAAGRFSLRFRDGRSRGQPTRGGRGARGRSPVTSPNEREQSTRAEPSYEAAVERLEEIIDRLDSGQAGLRETLDLCKEGKQPGRLLRRRARRGRRGPEGTQSRRPRREARLLGEPRVLIASSRSFDPAIAKVKVRNAQMAAAARGRSRGDPGPGSLGRGPRCARAPGRARSRRR